METCSGPFFVGRGGSVIGIDAATLRTILETSGFETGTDKALAYRDALQSAKQAADDLSPSVDQAGQATQRSGQSHEQAGRAAEGHSAGLKQVSEAAGVMGGVLSNANVPMSEMSRLGGELKTRFGELSEGGLSFANAMEIAGTAVAGGLVIGVGKAISGFSELTTAIHETSEMTGVSMQTVQELGYGLTTLGQSADGAQRSLVIMERNAGQLADALARGTAPSAAFSGAIEKLGLDLNSFAAAKPDEQLRMLMDAFERAPESINKTEVAVQVFGRGGAQMIGLLNEGAGALDKWGAKIGDAGASVDGAWPKVQQFHEATAGLTVAMQGMEVQLGSAVIPVVTQFLDVVGEGAVAAEHLPAPLMAAGAAAGAAALAFGVLVPAIEAAEAASVAFVAANPEILLLAAAAAAVGAAYEKWGGQSQAVSAEQDKVAASAKSAGEAIQGQVEAITHLKGATPEQTLASLSEGLKQAKDAANFAESALTDYSRSLANGTPMTDAWRESMLKTDPVYKQLTLNAHEANTEVGVWAVQTRVFTEQQNAATAAALAASPAYIAAGHALAQERQDAQDLVTQLDKVTVAQHGFGTGLGDALKGLHDELPKLRDEAINSADAVTRLEDAFTKAKESGDWSAMLTAFEGELGNADVKIGKIHDDYAGMLHIPSQEELNFKAQISGLTLQIDQFLAALSNGSPAQQHVAALQKIVDQDINTGAKLSETTKAQEALNLAISQTDGGAAAAQIQKQIDALVPQRTALQDSLTAAVDSKNAQIDYGNAAAGTAPSLQAQLNVQLPLNTAVAGGVQPAKDMAGATDTLGNSAHTTAGKIDEVTQRLIEFSRQAGVTMPAIGAIATGLQGGATSFPATGAGTTGGASGLMLPTPITAGFNQNYGISQYYGPTSQPGEPGGKHEGIDIALPSGTPLKAGGGGTIQAVNFEGADYGLGLSIVIKLDNGMTETFGHLSNVISTLDVGAAVKEGQVVAYSGDTGNSTGPHTHVVVRDANGNLVDPLSVLANVGGSPIPMGDPRNAILPPPNLANVYNPGGGAPVPVTVVGPGGSTPIGAAQVNTSGGLAGATAIPNASVNSDGTLTAAGIAQLLVNAGARDPDTIARLTAIGLAESSGNAGINNLQGSGAAGLFQFMPGTAAAVNLANPYDPQQAAAAALRLLPLQGYNAWEAHTVGTDQPYMAEAVAAAQAALARGPGATTGVSLPTAGPNGQLPTPAPEDAAKPLTADQLASSFDKATQSAVTFGDEWKKVTTDIPIGLQTVTQAQLDAGTKARDDARLTAENAISQAGISNQQVIDDIQNGAPAEQLKADERQRDSDAQTASQAVSEYDKANAALTTLTTQRTAQQQAADAAILQSTIDRTNGQRALAKEATDFFRVNDLDTMAGHEAITQQTAIHDQAVFDTSKQKALQGIADQITAQKAYNDAVLALDDARARGVVGNELKIYENAVTTDQAILTSATTTSGELVQNAEQAAAKLIAANQSVLKDDEQGVRSRVSLGNQEYDIALKLQDPTLSPSQRGALQTEATQLPGLESKLEQLQTALPKLEEAFSVAPAGSPQAAALEAAIGQNIEAQNLAARAVTALGTAANSAAKGLTDVDIATINKGLEQVGGGHIMQANEVPTPAVSAYWEAYGSAVAGGASPAEATRAALSATSTDLAGKQASAAVAAANPALDAAIAASKPLVDAMTTAVPPNTAAQNDNTKATIDNTAALRAQIPGGQTTGSGALAAAGLPNVIGPDGPLAKGADKFANDTVPTLSTAGGHFDNAASSGQRASEKMGSAADMTYLAAQGHVQANGQLSSGGSGLVNASGVLGSGSEKLSHSSDTLAQAAQHLAGLQLPTASINGMPSAFGPAGTGVTDAGFQGTAQEQGQFEGYTYASARTLSDSNRAQAAIAEIGPRTALNEQAYRAITDANDKLAGKTTDQTAATTDNTKAVQSLTSAVSSGGGGAGGGDFFPGGGGSSGIGSYFGGRQAANAFYDQNGVLHPAVTPIAAGLITGQSDITGMSQILSSPGASQAQLSAVAFQSYTPPQPAAGPGAFGGFGGGIGAFGGSSLPAPRDPDAGVFQGPQVLTAFQVATADLRATADALANAKIQNTTVLDGKVILDTVSNWLTAGNRAHARLV